MNSICKVCFELVRSTETQIPFVTRCGHLFHEKCIKNCLEKGSVGKCPQCNQPTMSSQLIRLHVNTPDALFKAKDEMIKELKERLFTELLEKSELQRFYINVLELHFRPKELSKKEETKWYQSIGNASDEVPTLSKNVFISQTQDIAGNASGSPINRSNLAETDTLVQSCSAPISPVSTFSNGSIPTSFKNILENSSTTTSTFEQACEAAKTSVQSERLRTSLDENSSFSTPRIRSASKRRLSSADSPSFRKKLFDEFSQWRSNKYSSANFGSSSAAIKKTTIQKKVLKVPVKDV